MIEGNERVHPSMRGDGAYTALNLESGIGETYTKVDPKRIMPPDEIQRVLSEDLACPVEVQYQVRDISNIACQVLSQLRMHDKIDINSCGAAEKALTFAAPIAVITEQRSLFAERVLEHMNRNGITKSGALAASIAEAWRDASGVQEFRRKKRALLEKQEPVDVARALCIFQRELIPNLKEMLAAKPTRRRGRRPQWETEIATT